MRQSNIYDIMKNNLDEFDTSDYSDPNQFSVPLANKKVPCKMKNECNTPIIGLRSKMYCTKIDDENPIKKAKGVKSNVLENKIEFEGYYKCLFDKEIAVRKQHS